MPVAVVVAVGVASGAAAAVGTAVAGAFVAGTVSAATATAVGAGTLAAGATLATGGSASDALKAGVTTGLTVGVASSISAGAAGASGAGAASSAATTVAVNAAIGAGVAVVTGEDPLKGAILGGLLIDPSAAGAAVGSALVSSGVVSAVTPAVAAGVGASLSATSATLVAGGKVSDALKSGIVSGVGVTVGSIAGDYVATKISAAGAGTISTEIAKRVTSNVTTATITGGDVKQAAVLGLVSTLPKVLETNVEGWKEVPQVVKEGVYAAAGAMATGQDIDEAAKSAIIGSVVRSSGIVTKALDQIPGFDSWARDPKNTPYAKMVVGSITSGLTAGLEGKKVSAAMERTLTNMAVKYIKSEVAAGAKSVGAKLTQTLQNASSRLPAIQKEVSDLAGKRDSAYAKYSEIDAEVRRRQEAVNKLEKEFFDLKEQVENQAEDLIDERSDLYRDYTRLRSQLNADQQDLVRYQKDLDYWLGVLEKEQAKGSKSGVRTAQKRAEMYVNLMNSTGEDIESNLKTYKSLEGQITSIDKQVNKLYASLDRPFDNLESSINDLNNYWSQNEKTYNSLIDQIKTSDSQIATLSKEFTNTERAATQAASQLVTLNEQNEKAMTDISNASANIGSIVNGQIFDKAEGKPVEDLGTVVMNGQRYELGEVLVKASQEDGWEFAVAPNGQEVIWSRDKGIIEIYNPGEEKPVQTYEGAWGEDLGGEFGTLSSILDAGADAASALGDMFWFNKSFRDAYQDLKGPTKTYLNALAKAARPESTTVDALVGINDGFRFIADAFGANNPLSQYFNQTREDLYSLYSAQARGDQAEANRILEEAKEKGTLDKLIAVAEAIKAYPGAILQAAGTSGTALLVASATAVLNAPVSVAFIAQGGLGAVTGAGVVKGTIYDEVKKALTQANQDKGLNLTAAEIEMKAQEAQAYNGKNLDQILLGSLVGTAAGLTGAEAALLSQQLAKTVALNATAKVGAKEFVTGGVLKTVVPETVLEGSQGFQQKVAGNVALQREGFNVDTFAGADIAGFYEGALGGLSSGPAAIANLSQQLSPEEQAALPTLSPQQQAVIDKAQGIATDFNERIAEQQAILENPNSTQQDKSLASARITSLEKRLDSAIDRELEAFSKLDYVVQEPSVTPQPDLPPVEPVAPTSPEVDAGTIVPGITDTAPEVTPGVTPEPTPGVTPEVTPEPTPETTPGVTPEVTPEPTPEVTPEPAPEPTPEVTPGITPQPEPELPEEEEPEQPTLTPEQQAAAQRAAAQRSAATRASILKSAGALATGMVLPGITQETIPPEEQRETPTGIYTVGEPKEFESPLQAFLEKVDEEKYTPEQEQKAEENQMVPQSTYFNYGQTTEVDDALGVQDATLQMLRDPYGSAYRQMMTQEYGQATPFMQSIMQPYGKKDGGLMNASLMAASGGRITGGLDTVYHSGKERIDFREGKAVTGPGDGQSDDIPAMLADGEFVIPADVVAALGNGSTKAGSERLYDMMHTIRREVRSTKPEELPPETKSPLQYLAGLKKTRRS